MNLINIDYLDLHISSEIIYDSSEKGHHTNLTHIAPSVGPGSVFISHKTTFIKSLIFFKKDGIWIID